MSRSEVSLSPDQIEYKVSAPALHAARTIALHFHFIEKSDSDIPYCDHNVAVLIDVHTQAFRIKDAMRACFASREFYYPDLNDLEQNLESVQHHVSELDRLRHRLPRFVDDERLHQRLGVENKPAPGTPLDANEYGVSAPALNAARMLMRHFDFVEREDTFVFLSEKNIAGIIDTCTEIRHLESALHLICTQTRWQHKDELRNNLNVMRKAMHTLDTAQMRMPTYSREMGRPIWKTRHHDATEITEAQMRRSQQAQAALKNARNPQDAARILQAYSMRIAV